MRKGKSFTLMILLMITVPLPGQKILEEYIRTGLSDNLALLQKQAGYLKSIEALREARALFYPDLSFNARYSVSSGGRVINLPIGDLLNPVYSTLNALTASDNFPSITNQQIKFLRPTEQETKLRLIQPLFNTDILYNARIKKGMTDFEEADMEQYKRELVTEIKKAYYNISMADGVLAMLNETRKLLTENVRVNQKLLENEKVTKDVLLRSKAELGRFDQRLQEAERDRIVAAAYFNFLLNRPLNDSIIIMQPISYPKLSDLTGDLTASAIKKREEIKKLEQYLNITGLNLKRNQAGALPDMFMAIDYGFQGEKYEFNRDAEYVQASAILKWNLFRGFENKARINQAKLDRQMADQKLEEAKKQIELQVINTLNELKTSEKGIAAAESTLSDAREGFRLVEKKYGQGQASLIEFLDARTSLTQSEENLIVSKYRYLSDFAEFEKVTGEKKY